jgi:hypothetical protein
MSQYMKNGESYGIYKLKMGSDRVPLALKYANANLVAVRWLIKVAVRPIGVRFYPKRTLLMTLDIPDFSPSYLPVSASPPL